MPERIPFNKPQLCGDELNYIADAHSSGALSGNGPYSRRSEDILKSLTGSEAACLTHSCTAALEMTALLLDLKAGDEVIMPSFTFVSTANAFALRGAVPVFVDIRPDTFNLDESLIERAITARTRAICVVHYAGIGCEMDEILRLARKYDLAVIEDAAQGIAASYRGQALGSFGRFGALSFHETKNATCGEGGALLLNNAGDYERAEVMREKGTDRSKFLRGMVDKYSWRDIGSSFLLGELAAAFLTAQLENVQALTSKRLAIWDSYHDLCKPLEMAGHIRRPIVPDHCTHNAHMYAALLAPGIDRTAALQEMNAAGVNAVFHYVPLHNTEAGERLGRADGDLPITCDIAARLVRLPLWPGMARSHVERVVSVLCDVIAKN